MILHIVRLDFDNLLVLLNRQLQDVLRAVVAGLHVTERPQVNAAQQLAGFKVIGITFDYVLRFEHRVANAARLGVKLRQSRGQVLRCGIGVDRLAVFLDGFIG